MKTTLVRSARWALIALLSAGLLAYVRRIPWTSALGTMQHASFELLALALAFHLLALTGKAGIWWTFLEPLGGPRFTTVARGTLMGATLNSLFVGGGGEAGRVVLMSRLTGISSASVLSTVVLERAVDLCGFFSLLACAAFLFPVARTLSFFALGALGIIAVLSIARHTGRRRGARGALDVGGSNAIVARCRRFIRGVFESTRAIATKRRLGIALALTLVDWCSELASYSLVARAAHFPIGVSGSLLVLLAVNVGFLVRVTPGNVGVFELVYASVAHSLGLPTDTALGVALLLHLVQDVPTTILGLTLGMRFFGRARSPDAVGRQASAAERPMITVTHSPALPTESARGISP